jgi:hypothetical protein
MAARISPSTLVRRTPRHGVDARVDVEDEVRASIYGESAGAVVAVGAAGSKGEQERPGGYREQPDRVRPGAGGAAARGGPAIPTKPPASDVRPGADEPEGSLAAALLGELDPAAREAVLARAAIELAADRPRVVGEGEGSPDRARDVRDRARVGRAAALRRGLPRAQPVRACERSIASDAPAAPTSRYRVVIDRGRGHSRSHVEFSTSAPSARGAVAANVRGPDSSVSAVNEVEPADRFSWRPGGSCQCTPASFTNCASGSELDPEGRCRDCGLQVLPPRSGLVGAGREARRAWFGVRLSAKLARSVREIAHAGRGARRAAPPA